MTYTVTGFHRGVSYAVAVGHPDADEVVSGDISILGLLQDHAGESFRGSVTGEAVPLDLGVPDTVLPALRALTEVSSIDGDAPAEDNDFDPRVEY